METEVRRAAYPETLGETLGPRFDLVSDLVLVQLEKPGTSFVTRGWNLWPRRPVDRLSGKGNIFGDLGETGATHIVTASLNCIVFRWDMYVSQAAELLGVGEIFNT